MMVICSCVRPGFCCQTAISLLTWEHGMNSALSRNSLKVLGSICCKHWEMPLALLGLKSPLEASLPSDFPLGRVRLGPCPELGLLLARTELLCAVEQEWEGSARQTERRAAETSSLQTHC